MLAIIGKKETSPSKISERTDDKKLSLWMYSPFIKLSTLLTKPPLNKLLALSSSPSIYVSRSAKSKSESCSSISSLISSSISSSSLLSATTYGVFISKPSIVKLPKKEDTKIIKTMAKTHLLCLFLSLFFLMLEVTP